MFAKNTKPDLHEELLEVLSWSVTHAFKMQAGVEATLVRNEREKLKKLFPASLVSEIALDATEYKMNLDLVIPVPVIFEIMGTILGEKITEVNEVVQDFPLEVANLVLGETKRILNERGHGIAMARPRSLAIGELIRSRELLTLQTYRTQAGEFFLCLCQREET